MKNLWILGGLVMLLALFTVACGDDDDSNGPEDDGGTDAGCEVPVPDYGDVCLHDIGECFVMEECTESGYCEVYSAAPWDSLASCAAAPPVGTTRFTGAVRDFETNDLLVGTTVRFADGATVLAFPDGAYDTFYDFEIVSDADGEFAYNYEWTVGDGDMGIVSLIKETGYFFTATGFVEPTADRQAPTGSLNHHAMAIPETLVTTLKALAAADPGAAKYNPNIFGKVVYNDLVDKDGRPVPVQGATIENTTGSNMEVYYVNEAMDALDACVTASHGLFILARPAIKDKVRTMRGTTEIGYYENTMGDAPQNLVYAVYVPVYSADDPGAPAVNCP